MRQEEPTHIMQQLQNIPTGSLTVVQNCPSGQKYILLTTNFLQKQLEREDWKRTMCFPV